MNCIKVYVTIIVVIIVAVIVVEKKVPIMYTKLQLDMIINEITNSVRDILSSKFYKIILYGSYARGDYDNESDIDIMILADLRNDEISALRKKLTKLRVKSV